MEKSALARCHPAAPFLLFSLILLGVMCLMDPLCLGVSLLSAALYGFLTEGGRELLQQLKRALPLGLFTGLVNALLVHRGETVLFRLPIGAVTLESLLYGCAAGVMLAASLTWFMSFGRILTGEGLFTLFGKFAPSLAMLLTLALGLLPRMSRRLEEIKEGQRALGKAEGRTVLQRLRQSVSELSILVTWALESGVDTADSMRSRGYGLPGRTGFEIRPFGRRELFVTLWAALLAGLLLAGGIAGCFTWQWYPRIAGPAPAFLAFLSHGAFLLLCLTPSLLELSDSLRWARSRRAERGCGR